MRKSIVILITILILCSFAGDRNPLSEIVQLINQHFEDRPMEKVHLHLDKPYYAVGDDLWYSGYVFNYQNHLPTEMSEILHVELFDHSGKIILQQKKMLTAGLTHGLLQLPDTLLPGYYLLKGYTSWSRNFAEELHFNHFIKVVSSNHESTDITKNVNLDFHVEGRTFLANKLNRLVFKTDNLDSDTVYLINSKKDTLWRSHYDGSGFGVVSTIPKKEHEQLYMTFGEIGGRFELPIIRESGSQLRLVEKKSSYDLVIENSKDFNDEPFIFLILNKGNIVSAQEGKFKESGVLLRLPKNALKFGVYHVILFDQELNVLNQRLFAHETKGQLAITYEKDVQLGDDIDIQLSSLESNEAFLSISVTPGAFFESLSKPTISDIPEINHDKSALNSLNDYFITEEVEAYHLEDILSAAKARYSFPMEKRNFFPLNIAIDMKEENKTDYFSISLKHNDTLDFYFSEWTDDDRLSVIVPSFNGQRNLILKPYPWSDGLKSIDYELNDTYPVQPFEKHFDQTATESAYARQVKENKIISRYFDVKNKTKIKNADTPMTLSILESFDASIQLREYITLPDMMTISKELLECVRFRKEEDGTYKIYICGRDEETGYFQPLYEQEPLRVIDGLPIYDSKHIVGLDPLEVETINISYSKGILNGVEYHGILSIETIEGNFGRIADLGQGVFDFQGFAENIQFYLPDHPTDIPDFRSTYYWNPGIVLKRGETTNVSFPTSLEPGTFIVDIQGITSDGFPIEEKFNIEIIE